jgi:Breast carcinoma amplified sequence 2 (BCAS2)
MRRAFGRRARGDVTGQVYCRRNSWACGYSSEHLPYAKWHFQDNCSREGADLCTIGFCRSALDFKISSSPFQVHSAQMPSEAAPPIEIFDSLPYYDNDLEQFPFLKQKVEQELARQPKPPQTLHPRVPPPYQLFAVRAHTRRLKFLFDSILTSSLFKNLEQPVA